MKFNYGKEKMKFEAMWEKLRTEYKNAGMQDSDIQKMYEYDWEMFKKERVFCMHNQYMPDGIFNDDTYKDEGQNPLFEKFMEQLSVRDNYFSEESMEWTEQLENEVLRNALRRLSNEQLELIMKYYVQEKSVSEIAEVMNLSYTAVANRLERIRKKIRKSITK